MECDYVIRTIAKHKTLPVRANSVEGLQLGMGPGAGQGGGGTTDEDEEQVRSDESSENESLSPFFYRL